MEASSCPGCRQRDEIIARLQQQLATLTKRVRCLEEQLGKNASNSSLPPSANPPQAPKPVVKQPSGKKSGGQPGHPPTLQRRLPPARLQQIIPFVPTTCRRCGHTLPQKAQAHDPEPSWHQVAELPPLGAQVTEYQGQARTCPACQTVTQATIPADLCRHSFGPRLAATLAYLVGCHRVSRCGVEEIAQAVFDVPVSLGSICHLEEQMSQALAPAHAEAVDAVRAAQVKHADETSWSQAGKRRWLWLAATATVAAFVVHARRGLAGLQTLLGAVVAGIVVSDRWKVYEVLPDGRRQLCWAHLIRDFRALAERTGISRRIGENLLALSAVLFEYWPKVRDGTHSRQWFVGEVLSVIRPDVLSSLRRGLRSRCAATRGTCRELLAWEASLWTFAFVEGVEPTNNHAERVLRGAVLWRKGCFGSSSEGGCRFVERLLTVSQTLRLQGRPVLTYLYEALCAHRKGLPTPKLLPAD
ncbi:MAG TPA: IS66 family transposase [Gemmataceae bacterium]|nr:IS66 family transposase [Gemmataceae bacterium]